jgi:hypothetical protein
MVGVVVDRQVLHVLREGPLANKSKNIQEEDRMDQYPNS